MQIADLAGVRALLRGGGAARATAARPTGPRRQGQLPGQGGKVGALWLGHAAILGRARGRDRARSKPWEVTVTVTVTVTVSVCGKCDYRSATQRTSAPVSSSRTPCDRASYESAHLVADVSPAAAEHRKGGAVYRASRLRRGYDNLARELPSSCPPSRKNCPSHVLLP